MTMHFEYPALRLSSARRKQVAVATQTPAPTASPPTTEQGTTTSDEIQRARFDRAAACIRRLAHEDRLLRIKNAMSEAVERPRSFD